jgi:hypothetical protein
MTRVSQGWYPWLVFFQPGVTEEYEDKAFGLMQEIWSDRRV